MGIVNVEWLEEEPWIRWRFEGEVPVKVYIREVFLVSINLHVTEESFDKFIWNYNFLNPHYERSEELLLQWKLVQIEKEKEPLERKIKELDSQWEFYRFKLDCLLGINAIKESLK